VIGIAADTGKVGLPGRDRLPAPPSPPMSCVSTEHARRGQCPDYSLGISAGSTKLVYRVAAHPWQASVGINEAVVPVRALQVG
jgi:hypothetical protein